ncbi:TPA: hypothetical protein ACSJUJ_002389 [Legionella pneumophila]|uniref:hypothetical protein n=1 Tax=Legionellaceae TaxID=444 RepID=UPI00077084EA|nr:MULTISPECIES: hypothetical protein [Legionellaceae]MDW8880431.1 hypothetical protein [Legionella pneumophila subsp. fraseri]MCW8403920.1 hypothetical protein [Legionella pneumophila]MCW8407319.1 hypothetical protein [Legionella pneumophila]MCW8422992.1 hypothetical protein [Legionella sp. PATHC032]MCW8430036.1 hypothetical protein [Legionella pneumophila]
MRISKILCLGLFIISSIAFAKPAETIPSIQVINYKNDLAYIITAGPEVVHGSNYEEACSKLASYGYTWKIVPHKSADPACYSPTDNVLMGANTWYCADSTLAYYNTPWWLCSESFTTCPNPTWTRSNDGLSCSRPNSTCTETPATVSEVKLLAAIVYGEASATNSTYEEKAAIANAVVRYKNSNGYPTVNQLILDNPAYSAAASNKVVRYRQVMCSDVAIEYPDLYNAAMNALDPEGVDYANGGCFWDGNDLVTKGAKHRHYRKGYKFTDPTHDVLSVGDSAPANLTGKFGTYNYTFESTAGYGQTVFWKLTQEFLTAQRGKQCH